ncbi:MAG: biotin--[acetyl-CoA-carboxylase] ligase [Planctomycetaceae bacterium]
MLCGHTFPADDPIDEEQLCAPGGLRCVEVLVEAASTMDRARELAADPATSLPAAVIADRQTAGRGRRGAGWWQPPGSLAVSIVVDGSATLDGPQPIWSLACGIAVAETIRMLEPALDPRVRWPNDVEVDGRKLAGILVETAAGGRAIFGIGVNTSGSAADAPPALQPRVATLPDLTGRMLARQRFVTEFVPRLLDLLAAASVPADVARRYRPLCGLTGRPIRVYAGDRVHEGTCRGIADDGGLVVEAAAGTVVIRSGSLAAPGTEWHNDSGEPR